MPTLERIFPDDIHSNEIDRSILGLYLEEFVDTNCFIEKIVT